MVVLVGEKLLKELVIVGREVHCLYTFHNSLNLHAVEVGESNGFCLPSINLFGFFGYMYPFIRNILHYRYQ